MVIAPKTSKSQVGADFCCGWGNCHISDRRKMQGLIDIIGHYGKRYRLIFGADKTKVTITGSKHEIYQDINMWSLYGEKLKVSEDNDHLGLIVSGLNEEIKNVDKNIQSARDTLFGFLGNIFSYKCKLSKTVQYHTWTLFIKQVLRFHHKILRAILKLSSYSPEAALYILLGELHIEASLHLDIL